MAPPVGIQVRGAIVQVAVHAGHALPRLVVVLGDVELVATGEETGVRFVVDAPDIVREQPRKDEELVCERLRSAHCRDRLPLPVGVEVDDDPFDRRLVGVVSDEETKAIHRLLVEGVLAREQVAPPREFLSKDGVNTLGVALESERDTLVPLAETNTEREEHETPFWQRGDGLGEIVDILNRNSPALLVVGAPQGSELNFDGELIGILLGVVTNLLYRCRRKELAVQGVERPIDSTLGSDTVSELLGEPSVPNEHGKGFETFAKNTIKKACHGLTSFC